MSTPITPNGSLDALGLSLEDWASLSDEEQSKKITDLLSGKSETQIEETLKGIADDFKAEKDDLKSLARELKNQLRRDVLTDAEKAKVEDWLEMLGEIQLELEDYKDFSVDEDKSYKLHNVDMTDGSDINISQSSLKLDGETYTYKLGSAASPFGDEGDSRLTGVTSDGTESGTVIKDVNGDLKKNADDIKAALALDPGAHIEKQNIFITPPPGQHWTLASADTETGVYTFKVTNNDGEYSYVTFENAAEAIFIFSGGINAADLAVIKETWPTELLKHTYWGDDTQSFFSKLDLTTPSTGGGTSVIGGYTKSKEKLPQVDTYTDGALSAELQAKAQAALDKLYAFYDKPGDRTLTDVWNEIFADWSGISEANQANMIQHLAAAIGFSDKDDFKVLVGDAGELIKQKLSAAGEPTAASKALILAIDLLKDDMGAFIGGYFATEVLNPDEDEDPYKSGTWANHADNLKALDLVQKMAAEAGMDASAVEQYRAGEESFGVYGSSGIAIAAGDSTSLNGEEVQTFMDEAMQLLRTWDVTGNNNDPHLIRTEFNGVGESKKNALRALADILTNPNLSAEEKTDAIIAEIKKLKEEHEDDVAYAFLSALAKASPETFNNLFHSEGMEAKRGVLLQMITDGNLNGQRSNEQQRMDDHIKALFARPLPAYANDESLPPQLTEQSAQAMLDDIASRGYANADHNEYAAGLVEILENKGGLSRKEVIDKVFVYMSNVPTKYRDDMYLWLTRTVFAKDPAMFQTLFFSEESSLLRENALKMAHEGNLFGGARVNQAHDKAFMTYLLGDRAETNIYAYVERRHETATAQPS